MSFIVTPCQSTLGRQERPYEDKISMGSVKFQKKNQGYLFAHSIRKEIMTQHFKNENKKEIILKDTQNYT